MRLSTLTMIVEFSKIERDIIGVPQHMTIEQYRRERFALALTLCHMRHALGVAATRTAIFERHPEYPQCRHHTV